MGTVDGKHVTIWPPKETKESASYYIHCKGSHGIALMAVIYATNVFVYVDVRRNGRVLGSGTWQFFSVFTPA